MSERWLGTHDKLGARSTQKDNIRVLVVGGEMVLQVFLLLETHQ